MELMRKAMGVLLALLGTCYCALSGFTLATLPGVTSAWIQRSGDPDFKYDHDLFMLWIGVGAVLVGAFGYRTAVKGVRAARGHRESWLALALGAPVLHWFWFVLRIIGNGVLGREAQATAARLNGLRFGAICLAYLAMWILMRRGSPAQQPATNAMHRTMVGEL